MNTLDKYYEKMEDKKSQNDRLTRILIQPDIAEEMALALKKVTLIESQNTTSYHLTRWERQRLQELSYELTNSSIIRRENV